MRFLPHFSAALTAVALLSGAAQAADQLPSLKADLSQTTVSGLSSGAFMAVQYQVAHSSTVKGAGIVAGGPYMCAQDNMMYAAACMSPNMFWPIVQTLVDQALENSKKGAIDPVENLSSSRYYLFSGKNDIIVAQQAMNDLKDFYTRLKVPAAQIKYVNHVNAGHAFISPLTGNDCGTNGAPYVNKCHSQGGYYDQPEELLTQLYGALTPASAINGEAKPFDQKIFKGQGLSDTGYVYVPQACAGGATCKIHVVFHGCTQSVENQGIGDVVYNQVGYNRWAETNNIMVLYPQVATGTLGNPMTCWDWFGYTGPEYATLKGSQIAAVNAMVRRLAGQ